MSDYEIDQIRRIRHQISAEHHHDLRKVAEYYVSSTASTCESVPSRLSGSGTEFRLECPETNQRDGGVNLWPNSSCEMSNRQSSPD